MNEKQKLFADIYIETLNAAEAARQAGYSEKTARTIGQQLLTKLDIREYINEQLAAMKKETIAKQEEVLEYLTRVMRGDEKETVVVLDKEDKPREITKPIAQRDRTKAAELLGKRYKLFIDKVEQENSGTSEVNVNIKVIK